MHGGKAPGAPKGNSHALSHGRYSAEAIAERRELGTLLRDMKAPSRSRATNEPAGAFSVRKRPATLWFAGSHPVQSVRIRANNGF
jgi:hypothetical protein